ncbi:MAG: PAS and helix-turn-helix domain-containing protein [Deltaproteobacteria bacterium]|nr:PAS and helix-turn-helix domain-containing protein [Deltaproteobacteria bacterium]
MDTQELNEKLRDYEHLIATMNCGLVAEDPHGKLVFVNQRLLDWLGYERDELIGRPATVLVPDELHQFMDDDLHAAEDGDLRARLIAARRKDSTTFPVVTIPQRFLTAEGTFDGYFYIVVDLGAVLTARQIGPPTAVDVRSALHRIALELQSISLSAEVGTVTALPLHHPDLQDVSPRESEVLAVLVAGERVPAIAKRLHISPHTVRNHLKSMFRKLEVGTQSELIDRVRSLADNAPSGQA